MSKKSKMLSYLIATSLVMSTSSATFVKADTLTLPALPTKTGAGPMMGAPTMGAPIMGAPTTQTAATRIFGANRYVTSTEIAKKGWTTSDTVILANGEDFADGLCAGPLANSLGAPILLTSKTSISDDTLKEITTLKAKSVIIVGGIGAVSDEVKAQLNSIGITDISRIAGANRYETSYAVAAKLGKSTSVAVVYGENFPDALSIASIASKLKMPILLSDKDGLSSYAAKYIKDNNVTTTYLIGGTGVLASKIESQVPGAVRISGTDRYDTNLNVITKFKDSIDFSKVYVATGEKFADALSGAALAAITGSPIVLTNGAVSTSVSTFLKTVMTKSTSIALGGTDVVADATVTSLNGASAAGGAGMPGGAPPALDAPGVVKTLVAAGTITQAQGDKIVALFAAGMPAPSGDGPLSSLVADKTLTKEQAQAVLDKLFVGMGPGAGAGGAMPGGAAGGANTQGVTATATDVPYVTGSKLASQTLDVYLPATGNGPFPVIVAIHGGGFKFGDKNSSEVNDELVGLTKGYAVISVNYRTSGEAPFPAAVLDVKAAIRFIKANASKYNLNPNKIAAWGDSAGANLAAMLGTSSGVTTVEDLTMGNAEQSSKVQAVVDFFGPINFTTMDAENTASGIAGAQSHGTADSFESAYMGADITTIPDKVKLANPTTYITADDSPFFIENGTKDTNVPTQQSVDFAATLSKVIGADKVTYIKLEGAGHGGDQFDDAENLDKVYSFLDKYLK